MQDLCTDCTEQNTNCRPLPPTPHDKMRQKPPDGWYAISSAKQQKQSRPHITAVCDIRDSLFIQLRIYDAFAGGTCAALSIFSINIP